MNTNATRERLLTPAEVAEMLGVSEGTLSVWRCVKRVALPYVKCGRAVRYSEKTVREFIVENTVGAVA